MAEKKTRVLIVEKEGLFRDLLARTLAGETTLEVVGLAGDGDTAVRLAKELQPDVVLSCVSPPGGPDGIQLGQAIKEGRPQTGIVILASAKQRHLLARMPQAEGPGWCYLLKESVTSMPVLVRAIESSAMGLMVIDPKLLASRLSPEDTGWTKLSSRHRAVLELMAEGYNNHAIAKKLAPLGEKSVENYVNHIYKQLGFARGGPWHPRVKAVLGYLEEGRSIASAH